MKILNRYIISEIIPSFFVGLGFFTFIFVIQKLIILLDMIIVKKVNAFKILELLLYMLPFTLAITIPMAVLTSVLITFGRLSSDSEIIAMHASGVSSYKIFIAPIIYGILLSILCSIFNDTVLPAGNYSFKQLYKTIAEQKPLIQLEEHSLVTIENRTIGVDKIDHKKNKMNNIVIYEKDAQSGLLRTILSAAGTWLSTETKRISKTENLVIMRLKLTNGRMLEPNPDNPKDFHIRPFDETIITLRQYQTIAAEVQRGAREMNSTQLYNMIKEYKQNNIPVHYLWVEFHKKFSIPWACLAFALLGAPLGITPKRGGKSIGLGFSVIIIFIYYLLLLFGEELGKENKLNPFLAVWLPNFILYLIGIGLIWARSLRF